MASVEAVAPAVMHPVDGVIVSDRALSATGIAVDVLDLHSRRRRHREPRERRGRSPNEHQLVR